MRARGALAALAALAGACEPAGPCDAYAVEPAVVAECASRHVPVTPSVDEARAACARMGVAEDACLSAWAFQHAEPHDLARRDELLALCGADEDCAFRVLDQRPAGQLAVEVGDCRARAARYGDDCVGHAMQRFAATHPSAAACDDARAIGDDAVIARMLPGTCP